MSSFKKPLSAKLPGPTPSAQPDAERPKRIAITADPGETRLPVLLVAQTIR
ncbi:hypothetical protein [Rhizobium sp. 2MFCol3.1]|uniref:hypothetical protein n=1 Tax=Rhizobium sp. 2MFCol3.1 TaxID=1246459 RepID=UPI000361184C|nr:hypothetical protein [Rhizobium sp. 2MFCol3.1]